MTEINFSTLRIITYYWRNAEKIATVQFVQLKIKLESNYVVGKEAGVVSS
jgi:hypothetical protein